ncbi:MATE family efflux transporter [Bacteroidales bacterium OttesenSCG-928-I14]|nr:MATE family efflux transporter [Bacteroidales bacterium OttesenSCG-928-I14]
MKKVSYSYAHIWKIAYPILLTLLAQHLIQAIDTAFLGHVGEIELGASAIAGIFYVALFTIAFGFSTGSQILIGRRNGEGNYKKIGETVVFGAAFLWLLAIIIFILVQTAAEPILQMVLSSDKILDACVEYLDWRIYGLFFSTINVMFRAFFVGITKTKVLSVNAIIMALTNVLFDYLLIFGNWGFPQMGIAGAAIASVISEAVSVVFFIIYLFVAVDLKKYGFTGISIKQFTIIKSILNISFSLMVQSFLSVSTWLIFFFAIERMGEATLAASNIIRSLYGIIGIPVWALGTTSNTLVSNIIGEGKQDEVVPLIWKVNRFGLIIVAIVMIVLLAAPRLIISIYTSDPNIINLTLPSFYVIMGVLPVFVLGNTFFQSVSGTGNTRSALAIEIFTLVIYTFWIWLMAIHIQAPLHICWISELIYAAGLGILSFIYFSRGKWKNKNI